MEAGRGGSYGRSWLSEVETHPRRGMMARKEVQRRTLRKRNSTAFQGSLFRKSCIKEQHLCVCVCVFVCDIIYHIKVGNWKSE